MIAHSVSFFRHRDSNYEHPNCGESQGRFFSNFIGTLVRAHAVVWPECDLVIHHDDRVQELPVFKALETLAKHSFNIRLRLVDCGPAQQLCRSMLWRMRPCFDPRYSMVICRDVDSLPMDRDRGMIVQFMDSGLDAHAILDSESHSGPFMGGMVAFRTEAMRPRQSLYEAALADADLTKHGSDQQLLNQVLWPELQARTMIHQRRYDVSYNAASVLLCPPQLSPLDKVVRHIGAAYDIPAAMAALEERLSDAFKAELKQVGL